MKTLVVSDLFAVRRRLDELQVELSSLVEAVRAGGIARQNCTELDPRMYPGTTMWATTVRILRDGLKPKGWQICEAGNFSRTVSPDSALSIVVATGDEATGIPRAYPTTQSAKGPRTVEVVASNAYQLDLPFEWPENRRLISENGKPATWILLIHYVGDQVRAEFSRPVSFDDSQRVIGWHERIILPSVDLEPDSIEFDPDDSPDVDVPVERRL